ncbi:SRPBCC family protein [Roseibium aestuarii]|uniref:Carbon monoxide dehydrogenase subunit G n=1 Tax=Roseibium aestuarii TaxID=2600299 RepID=A0ABW4JUP3_9HYPH|nr:carbon monoxide dehydrogenase subunit G [Roseibium aestuarii]
MDIQGEYRIPASRETVWAALNDPDILRECIPGCDTLEKTDDTHMQAVVTAKVGPVKAKFTGAVTLEDLNPPESYRIVGEGKGGVAGFAKGGAEVRLAEDGAETILTYVANAQVGGKLAQLGSRLIDSTARKMADEFFGAFSRRLGAVDAPLSDDDLDAGVMEEARHIAMEDAPYHLAEAIEDAEEAIERRVHDAEEKVEVAAGRGVLGGPFVWGLIALAVIIAALALAN